MVKRTITSVFILAFVVLFVVLKQFSDLIFDAFLLLMMYGALIETVNVYKKAEKKIDIMIFIIPIVICTIFNLAENTLVAFGYEVLMTVLFILYLLTSEIISYGFNRKHQSETDEIDIEAQNKTLFDKTRYTMQVFAYPLLVLSMLFALNHLGFELSYMGIILSFAVAMMTDTFAYLFGKLFGKRKFIPEVSPNKTIAGMIGGFFGGIVASIVALLVFSKLTIFNAPILANKSMFITIFSVIGVLGAWADQLGDLIASALKRKVGVKDYSNIFPGHGGVMDRVDGLMFTASLICILFVLFLV